MCKPKPSLPPGGIDTRTHRYPFCLCWTPIHPLSWVAPYVGHCGVADASGRVLDFSGPYHVSHDQMLFGWPTRCLQLEEQKSCGSEGSYDAKVYELARRYERRGCYDFLAWNCHSLVASVLNETEHPRDPLARCFGGWTVVGVAWLFFARARHLGTSGLVQTWGGHVLLWGLVLGECAHTQSLDMLLGWLYLQGGFLAFFAGWFSLLALLRFDSQFGRIGGTLVDSPQLKPAEEEEDDRGRVPLRCDSFGDLVPDVDVDE